MLSLIVLLPLIGFVANAAIGRRLSKRASGGLATGVMFAAFGASIAAVGRMLDAPGHALEERPFTWIPSGELHVDFALRLDSLAAVMILVVTGIGALIHLYSIAYMHGERDSEYARYFSYLNLFAAFMLVLVLGASFPVLFVGWEGVGLCSYLLIGFWFQKPSAADAGKKAFVVNRIGDAGFILGMLLIFDVFGTLDIQRVAAAVAERPIEAGTLTIITLLLFLGATGKSAQIPLHVWLPDAMEGPTPVSALIHAATMVTAGVYMIARNAVLFSHAPITLDVVAIVGVATALMAGTIGLVQTDIKRVLAYSTVSQLGYMFLAMGVGAYAAGIFHLYTHAFFKALLFLGAGAVIHALGGEQDLRNMGGLRRELPVTYWTFLTGALAIAGVPFLSGFFSKDEILYRTFAGGHVRLWAVALVTSLLTAIYMFRLVFLVFHGERPAGSTSLQARHVSAQPGHLHDAPPSMAIPLVVLAIGSIVAGYVGVPHALGGSNRIERFLEPSFEVRLKPDATTEPGSVRLRPDATTEPGSVRLQADEATEPRSVRLQADEAVAASEPLELSLMAVSSVVAVGGIGIAIFFFLKRPDRADALARSFFGVYRVLLRKYYLDEIYDAVLVQPIKRISTAALWRGVDAGVIDGAVNGTGAIVRGASGVLRRLQTGSVRAYAVSLFLGVVVILGYYLWR